MSVRDDDMMSIASAKSVARSVSGGGGGGGGLNADDLQRHNGEAGGSTAATSKASSVKSKKNVDKELLAGFDVIESGDDVLTLWSSDKIAGLQSALKLAPWKDVSHNFQTVPNCMFGEEIAKWIIESNYAKNAEDAAVVGEAMYKRQMFFQFNKKSKRRGFNNDDTKYTLENQLANGNSIFTKMGCVATAKKVDFGPPVRLRQAGNFCFVVVEERERRLDGESGFSGAHLKESDGPNFSMLREDVPIPSVADSTPDQCDWAHDWEQVISDETDADGWRYQATDFRDVVKFLKGEASNKNFLVRVRDWQRPAMKRITMLRPIEKKEEEKTELELEEEKKKDMLTKTSQFIARVPRKGVLELSIHQGVDLFKVCDSYVVIEYRETTQKSDTCPKRNPHQWEFKLDVPIANDMEPVRATVFQANKIGKRAFMGQVEVYIEAHEVSGKSSIPLKPRENEQDPEILSGADALGTMKVSWKFNPDEASAEGVKEEKTSGAKRCILSLQMVKGEKLTKERRRIGPCSIPVPGSGSSAKCFFRLNYLGEFCDMFAQSPLFKFAPTVDFAWKVSIPFLVSSPVEVQFWVSDYPTPVGNFKLTFDAALTEETEHVVELKPIVVDGVSSAAVASLGMFTMKVHWVPELDSLQELIAGGQDVVVASVESKSRKNLLTTWD